MTKGLVSIITACYNGELFLNTYFTKLLEMSYDQIEIIFVNDGSTDKSLEIANKYVDKYIDRGYTLKILSQPNKGQAWAYNAALKEVTGEYLYWLDCDDYPEKNSIEHMVNYLINSKEYNIVRGNVRFHNPEKGTVEIKKPQDPQCTDLFHDYVFLGRECYCFPSIWLVKMSFFDKRVPNREIYLARGGQNWQMLLPILYHSKVGYIDEVIFNYFIHMDSHSHDVDSLKKIITYSKNAQNLLHGTFNMLQMPESEKKDYLSRIDAKYRKKRLKMRMHAFAKTVLPKTLVRWLRGRRK